MFPHPYTIEKSHGWIAMNLPKPDTSKTTALPDPAAQQPFSTPPTAVPATTEPLVAWPATLHYAICVDSECVGTIGLKPGVDVHVRSAEVGYWLGEAVWGRGIASEATAAFVDWVFENVPHLERLGGSVYSGNGASERVLRKVGFKKEGTLRKAVWKSGVWYDLEMHGLLRDEWVEMKQATSSERNS
ncbi:hypothetical protein MPH_10801 [Macrophomina phaseolina MS6]|uniref:N-acetyltransferase domain-containing protein n=1 Tax=Macrophomina phaseolina (strain MS6) TaxID=1126212 RepID=K2S5Y4_MACPH|nr:hypothetical protein MPH_10801 [Macrophomina phaseolina MS6]